VATLERLPTSEEATYSSTTVAAPRRPVPPPARAMRRVSSRSHRLLGWIAILVAIGLLAVLAGLALRRTGADDSLLQVPERLDGTTGTDNREGASLRRSETPSSVEERDRGTAR